MKEELRTIGECRDWVAANDPTSLTGKSVANTLSKHGWKRTVRGSTGIYEREVPQTNAGVGATHRRALAPWEIDARLAWQKAESEWDDEHSVLIEDLDVAMPNGVGIDAIAPGILEHGKTVARKAALTEVIVKLDKRYTMLVSKRDKSTSQQDMIRYDLAIDENRQLINELGAIAARIL